MRLEEAAVRKIRITNKRMPPAGPLGPIWFLYDDKDHVWRNERGHPMYPSGLYEDWEEYVEDYAEQRDKLHKLMNKDSGITNLRADELRCAFKDINLTPQSLCPHCNKTHNDHWLCGQRKKNEKQSLWKKFSEETPKYHQRVIVRAKPKWGFGYYFQIARWVDECLETGDSLMLSTEHYEWAPIPD